MTRFYHAWKMYDQLPMKHRSILPDEGMPTRLMQVADDLELPVYIKPKPRSGERWGHRVIAICKCGKHVPFGRLGQHYKTQACKDWKPGSHL